MKLLFSHHFAVKKKMKKKTRFFSHPDSILRFYTRFLHILSSWYKSGYNVSGVLICVYVSICLKEAATGGIL